MARWRAILFLSIFLVPAGWVEAEETYSLTPEQLERFRTHEDPQVRMAAERAGAGWPISLDEIGWLDDEIAKFGPSPSPSASPSSAPASAADADPQRDAKTSAPSDPTEQATQTSNGGENSPEAPAANPGENPEGVASAGAAGGAGGEAGTISQAKLDAALEKIRPGTAAASEKRLEEMARGDHDESYRVPSSLTAPSGVSGGELGRVGENGSTSSAVGNDFGSASRFESSRGDSGASLQSLETLAGGRSDTGSAGGSPGGTVYGSSNSASMPSGILDSAGVGTGVVSAESPPIGGTGVLGNVLADVSKSESNQLAQLARISEKGGNAIVGGIARSAARGIASQWARRLGGLFRSTPSQSGEAKSKNKFPRPRVLASLFPGLGKNFDIAFDERTVFFLAGLTGGAVTVGSGSLLLLALLRRRKRRR